MLKARSVAVCAVAVIVVLGFCIGAEADWYMMSAGTGCNSMILVLAWGQSTGFRESPLHSTCAAVARRSQRCACPFSLVAGPLAGLER